MILPRLDAPVSFSPPPTRVLEDGLIQRYRMMRRLSKA